MKMTKKMMFLFLLFPVIFGTADLYAQVTIGSDEEPHSGAILDLRSTDKGLKLPAVWLEDVTEFELSGNADNAEGMTVYNTNDNTKGGRGRGIYIWNGTWIYSGGAPKAEIPVNRIIITSPGGVNVVSADEPLQLTDSILPANASNKKVTWSVPWSSSLAAGKATVDDTGLVTPVKPGSITVRASAIDGSGASRDFALTIRPADKVESVTVSSENGNYSVEIGRTLQLLAAITPETAFPVVSWATDNLTSAVVDADGLVTGKAVGTANITASALDDLTKQGAVEVTVTKPTLDAPIDSVVIGNNKYPVYKFGTTTWTVANSHEGTYNCLGWGASGTGDAYYSYLNAPSACPSPGSLPTRAQAIALTNYLNFYATLAEKTLWLDFGEGGQRDMYGGWHYQNTTRASWWQLPSSSQISTFYVADAYFTVSGTANVDNANVWIMVRCVVAE